MFILDAKILEKFSSNPYVKTAFSGIRPVVTGLIATAVFGIFQTALFLDAEGNFQFPLFSVILCIVFFVLMNLKKLKKIHPFFWMVAGASVGIVLKM